MQGSGEAALSAGARCVLLDSAVVRAELTMSELGMPLEWTANARGQISEAQSHEHHAQAGLAWRPGHLRCEAGAGGLRLSWTRRSAEIADNWSMPEARNTGRFLIELLSSGEVVETAETDTAHWLYEGALDGIDSARVAEIGGDERIGSAAMIAISPNLS